MKFHIPRQHKPTKDRVDIRLEQSILQRLDQYCQYMESDRDYVIGTVLQLVFKKDKGFAEWLRAQEQAADVPRLGVERRPQRPGQPSGQAGA